MYKSKNFEIQLQEKKDRILLTQQVFAPEVNTRDLPVTYGVLKKHLPTVFKNRCFNENNLPFSKEVLETEVGHLFEHIVIEFMKREIEREMGYANIAAETSWDLDNTSHFDIEIDSGPNNQKYFLRALKKAIKVMEIIYSTNNSKKK